MKKVIPYFWNRPCFWKKREKALEKRLKCEFIRINTSRENPDADFEASKIQVFISQFTKNKIKH